MLDSLKTCLWLLCLLASGELAAGQNPPAAEMLTAAQVRSLTPQQAAQGLPVRLKGVVTICDEGFNSRFVQDDTAGIISSSATRRFHI
ncbi:MAG TPA: hypothetical protein VGY56_14240 [Verrucomicrobiae bacterium]|nr:hypothetical protein [Verrucomicrobiae bacterium]